MTRFLTHTLALALGIAIGLAGHWHYFKNTMSRIASTGQDMFASALYNYEVTEAQAQLRNPNKDIAIYALNRAVKNLEVFQAPYTVTCRKTAYELGRFNIRLALLYKETGNIAASDEHLKKAIASYQSMGWIFKDVAELSQAIPLIDAEKSGEAIQKYGHLGTPCDEK
jgi:hypothetical protein